MMNKKKILMGALIFAFAFHVVSFASTKVTYVSVNLQEEKVDPGIIYPVEVTANSYQYEITDVEVSKDYDDWKPGRKVTYTVTIEPTEGYNFSKKDTRTYASNGTIASDSVKSSKIMLKINYIPKVTLETPENIFFEDEYLAKWDEVAYASAYEVKLYKDGSYFKTVKVTDEEIDLADYATDYEDITFDVRAVPEDSDESKYLRNSEWINCDEPVTASDNTSYGQFRGNNDSLTFYDSDGYYATGWQYINGVWYFFNPNNGNKAIQSSWAQIDGTWYYFNSYCIMQTGWIQLNGTWYYLYPSGAMATGWVSTGPSGPWYYLDPASGAMWHDTVTPDGYYVNANGEWYN